VNSAAYKITRINPPEIFIRLEDGYEVKKILFKAIENLRAEVTEVQKVFKKLT
jgi:DNA-directed RNA polymerase subunit L